MIKGKKEGTKSSSISNSKINKKNIPVCTELEGWENQVNEGSYRK